MISSTQNERIKTWHKLHDRKHREQQQRFLIENPRDMERAVAAGVVLEVVLTLEGTASHLPAHEHISVSEAVMRKLSGKENPSHTMAVAIMPAATSLQQLNLPQQPLVLVLAGIEKPGNLGAILRSCDAAGVDAVLLEGGVELYAPQVVRNSTGAVFSLPIVCAQHQQILYFLQQNNLAIVATTPHTSHSLWHTNLAQGCALIMGTEHQGLPQRWLDAANVQVSIPMQGQADSLNVSVCTALVLFEARRQRSLS